MFLVFYKYLYFFLQSQSSSHHPSYLPDDRFFILAFTGCWNHFLVYNGLSSHCMLLDFGLNISLTQYFYCVSYLLFLLFFFSYFIPLCHLTVLYIEIETVFLRINNKYFLKFKINQTFHLFYSWLYFVHFISSVL